MMNYKYSTFWPRLGAGFVDGLIFAPINALQFFVFAHSTSVTLRVLVFTLNSLSRTFYTVFMHGKFGQTLGKMALKVIVLDVSERPLSMWQAVLRDILNVVLMPVIVAINIPRIIQGVDIYRQHSATTIEVILGFASLAWVLLEFVTMLTNNKRRALHDFIAGSVVIRKL